MAGVEFWQSRMGHAFYEGTMPSLVRELKRLNENIEKVADGSLLPKLATALMNVPIVDVLKPTGRDPEVFSEYLTTLIAEAENSGEAAGRMIGEHLDDMGSEDPDIIIAELQNIEEWAASIRKKLL